MPYKATVTHEGAEIEVEIPDDDLKSAGFVPRSDYVPKDFHEKEMDRVSDRYKGDARNAIREELKADKAFIDSVLEEHGKKPKEFDAEAFAESLRSKEVDPLKSELDNLRTRVRNAEIVQAAAPHVKDEFVQKVAGKDPYVVSLLADRLEYDADLGFVATDGKGNRLPGSNGGFATASDLVEQFKADDSLSFLFKPRERNGKGSEPSPGQGSPTTKAYQEMSEDEKNDFIAQHGAEGVRKALAAG